MDGMIEKRRVTGTTLAHEPLSAENGAEMFGFYIQSNEFRFLEKKIFVFIIFETKSESEAEVFVPDIRKAKFS